VPDDDQDGAGNGDLGLGLAAAAGDPVVPLAEEGGGAGGAVGGLGQGATQPGVALALFAGPGAGPDWRAEGHNPAQDTKWAAVGNRVPFNTQVRQTPLAANASGKLPQNGRPVTRGEVMMCADLRLGRSS